MAHDKMPEPDSWSHVISSKANKVNKNSSVLTMDQDTIEPTKIKPFNVLSSLESERKSDKVAPKEEKKYSLYVPLII